MLLLHILTLLISVTTTDVLLFSDFTGKETEIQRGEDIYLYI